MPLATRYSRDSRISSAATPSPQFVFEGSDRNGTGTMIVELAFRLLRGPVMGKMQHVNLATRSNLNRDSKVIYVSTWIEEDSLRWASVVLCLIH